MFLEDRRKDTCLPERLNEKCVFRVKSSISLSVKFYQPPQGKKRALKADLLQAFRSQCLHFESNVQLRTIFKSSPYVLCVNPQFYLPLPFSRNSFKYMPPIVHTAKRSRVQPVRFPRHRTCFSVGYHAPSCKTSLIFPPGSLAFDSMIPP